MITHGKVIPAIDIDMNRIIILDNDKCNLSSGSYFEGLITNSIQFFNKEYFNIKDKDTIVSMEIDRILNTPQNTNNVGKYIYNLHGIYNYHKALFGFIKEYFFDHDIEYLRYLYDISISKYNDCIDIPLNNNTYDFNEIGINCKVYLSNEFSHITPNLVYQISHHYNTIIMSHGLLNDEYWKISPISVNGVIIGNMDEAIINTNGDTLVLCCNDNNHDINDIDGRLINYPKYALMSELAL